MAIAIYPGTFDPLTRGHEDIVRRACKLFKIVVVGVAESKTKYPFFSLNDRVEIAREILRDNSQVRALGFKGLLKDFIEQNEASVVIRGLRAVSDFEYEFQMVGMNRQLNSEIETVFLMADAQRQSISSNFIRDIARLNGDISNFTTDYVSGKLKEKFNN